MNLLSHVMNDHAEKMVLEVQRLRKSNTAMRLALEKAVALYGQPGGPWNVPGSPGTWLQMAKKALGVVDNG